MPSEHSTDVKFEIGHVLFIDIVGYSKLLINEQSNQLQTLKQIVRGTEQFRLAKAEGKLLGLPTGDGGALVFRTSPEAPVLCAIEISRELKRHPELQVRMGIHSGPVNEITDLNEQANIAGAGINIAQRVMDCGDAGHILLSQHVADDLEQYPRWRAHLHELGECEVKHGVRLRTVNFYTDEVGNPEVPEKFKQHSEPKTAPAAFARAAHFPWHEIVIALLLLAALIAGFLFWQRGKSKASATAAAPEKSIAVLPFSNLSKEEENAFFADGVQDEILTNLAKIADLKVISRSSVMHYKSGVERNLRKIAEELGVAHVLEGSVQRAANRVRVNAQLIDARNDAHLWAQTYDRDLADVFAIQSEIAKTIADQLQAKLSPTEKSAIERPPTKDLTAFDLYTRAKNLWLMSWASATGKTDLLQATDLLNQAVTRDPAFFEAYCDLALTQFSLYFLGWDHTAARLAQGEAAVEAAVRLRRDAGETHLARARNRYFGYHDYAGALVELEISARLIPNDPWVAVLKGYIERRQGRWDESLQDQQRAIELDPRNILALQQLAITYQCLRRYSEAKSALARVLAFEPNDAVTNVWHAFLEFDSKGDTRPVHQTIDSIRATNPAGLPSIANYWLVSAMAERDPAAAINALLASGDNPMTTLGTSDNLTLDRAFIEGLIALLANDENKARSALTAARAEQEKIVQAQPNYAPASCVLGLIDAGLGRKEESLREARRATELLPVEKDALDGMSMVKYLAMTAALLGDKDLACEQLRFATEHPCDLSYGHLKLMPMWDSLRGDSRFEQIVASLAPKGEPKE